MGRGEDDDAYLHVRIQITHSCHFVLLISLRILKNAFLSFYIGDFKNNVDNYIDIESFKEKKKKQIIFCTDYKVYLENKFLF